MNRAEQFMLLRALRIPDSGGARGGVQKAVLRCIDDHSGQTGLCWTSLQTMAEETCFSKRTVIRAIADLEGSKMLVVERRDGRSGNYKINWLGVANQCQTVTSDRESPVPESHRTSARESPTSDRESPKTKVNQKKPSLLRASQFEDFWKQYPPRNGRRLNKRDAATQFAKLKDDDISPVMTAVKTYAGSDQLAMDAHRWLRKGLWCEWLQPAVELAAVSDDLDGLAGEDIGPRRTAS